ncbi:MAG TPA: DMT family transporter [Longimicrobiaceae bacterium]|nr:DMT family transporter [Longimicrobiaceae bacterium]
MASEATPQARVEAVPRPEVPPALVLLLSILAISWAAPLVRFSQAPALAVSFWRLAFSVALIAAVLTVRREWGALRRLSRGDLLTAAVAGVFLAGHFATWITSIGMTSVAASVLLVDTAPVFVAVLSAVFLRERPSRRQWAGILLAVAGAGWIGWGDFQGGTDPLKGDLLALSGAVLVAGYYVIGRRLRARIELWPFVGVVYGCAALTLLAVLPLAGVPYTGYAPTDWMVFAGLAVGPMMIGHTGQNWALRYLPAYVVNLSLLGEPVGATLIAWLLPAIAETPPPAALGGGALILLGLLLGMTRR